MMSTRRPLILAAALATALATALGTTAAAYVAWFDSLDAWQSATDDDVIAVTFDEAGWPVNQPLPGTWTMGGVSFTGFAGTPFPNIFVANFGSPFGSGNWMTANGDENIDLVPDEPPTAIAFEAAANEFGAATVRVYDAGEALVGELTIPEGTQRFVGITSNVPMARVNFSSVLGAISNTGFDTIRLAARATAPADLDGDGHVNGADLGLLIANWGGAGAGDLNCDGMVDGADLGLLVAAWTD